MKVSLTICTFPVESYGDYVALAVWGQMQGIFTSGVGHAMVDRLTKRKKNHNLNSKSSIYPYR